jgi:sulfite reductase (NADPH) hemoprotein beta-component
MHLGGDRLGHRLNKIYMENIEETEILRSLDGLLQIYAGYRNEGETFGDFSVRQNWVVQIS